MNKETVRSKTKIQPIKNHILWDEMISGWGSPVVARDQVAKFTGGLITGRTVANQDAKGEGPKERIELGLRRVGYPVKALVEWLKGRCTVSNVIIKNDGGDVDECS